MKTRNLKTITTKWLMTGSLVALLASTYSFNGHSYTNGELDLASRAPNYVGPNTNIGPEGFNTRNNQRPAAPPAVNNRVILIPQNNTETTQEITSTEADAGAIGYCDGCETVASQFAQLTEEDFLKMITRIEELENAYAKAQEQLVKHEDLKPELTEIEEICGVASDDESRQDKRDRLECEKKQKEKAKEDERIAKFEERADAIKYRCDGDLDCLASEFTSLVSRYDGRNSIPASVVAKQFKSVVATDLMKSLYSNDQDKMAAAMSALNTLISDSPEKYAFLKQASINIVEKRAEVKSQGIILQKQQLQATKDPQAYFQLLNEIQKEQASFEYLTNSYHSTITESVQVSDEASALDYYRKTYLPNMQKILLATRSGTTTQGSSLVPNEQNSSVNGNTQQNTLPAINNGTTNQPGQQGTIVFPDYNQNQMQQQVAPANGSQQWQAPANSNSVIFGAPTTTPQGTRFGRQ